MLTKVSLSLFTIVAAFLFYVVPTYAQTPSATPTPICQPVYGGGTNCVVTGSLVIDKTVENPQTNTFSDNLFQDSYVFTTSQNVTFKLTITNTTSNDIHNIHILDTLPINLDYVSSDGTFNNQNRTIVILDKTLAAKSSAHFEVTTKVNTQGLPDNQPVVCFTNSAQVQTTSFFFFSHTQSQDAAIFCISNSTQSPTITTPEEPTNPQTNTQVQPTSKQSIPTQTKGGQTVYTPPATSKSPATGSTTISLLLLPLFAFLGRKLRHVTK